MSITNRFAHQRPFLEAGLPVPARIVISNFSSLRVVFTWATATHTLSWASSLTTTGGESSYTTRWHTQKRDVTMWDAVAMLQVQDWRKMGPRVIVDCLDCDDDFITTWVIVEFLANYRRALEAHVN